MFDYTGARTIDDRSRDWIAAELDSPVALARHPEELVRLVRSVAHGVAMERYAAVPQT